MAIDILPEQEIVQKQYFTGVGEFNPQYQNSNVNGIYKKIINKKKIKLGFEVNSYQTGFNPVDTGTENYIGFIDRDGFDTCHDFGDLIVHDVAIFGDDRFFLTTNAAEDEVSIYKECGSRTTTDDCDGYFNTCPDMELATSSPFGVLVYDTTPCQYKRFQTTYGPSGALAQSGTNATIRHELIGNQITAYIRDASITITPTVGSYIYITATNSNNGLVGYWRQIIGTATLSAQTWIQVEGFWPGLAYDLTTFTGTSVTSSVYQWSVYPDVGNNLSFVTTDGVISIHGIDPGDCNTVYITTMPATGSITEPTDIRSIFNFGNRFGYLYENVLYISEGGYNNALFTTIIPLAEQYEDFVEVGQYGYLLGPDSMAILYRYFDSVGNIYYQVVTTEDSLGYFNKYSYLKYKGGFYVATADSDGKARWQSLYVNPSDKGNGLYGFNIGYTVVSKDWVNGDFSVINKHNGDKIFASSREGEIFIFATAASEPFTKIFIYDYDDKFWHIWHANGKQLRGYKFGLWYGEDANQMAGTLDWENSIKCILGISFGQQSIFSPKWVHGMYFIINSETDATNIKMKESINFGGYNRSKWIALSSIYTDNLTAMSGLNLSTVDDQKESNLIFATMPMSLGLYGGNGIGINYDSVPTLSSDIDAFNAYGVTGGDVAITDCDTNEEVVGNIQDPEQAEFNVAKYGILYYPLGDQIEHCYIEFLSYGTSKLSFGGYMLTWNFINKENLVLPQNTITRNDLSSINAC